MVMKRFHAAAKGRGNRILKPFSNMTVVVAEQEVAPKAVKKTAEKATEKTAAKPAAKKTTKKKETK